MTEKNFKGCYPIPQRINSGLSYYGKLTDSGVTVRRQPLIRYRCKKNGVRVERVAEDVPDGPEGVILDSVA